MKANFKDIEISMSIEDAQNLNEELRQLRRYIEDIECSIHGGFDHDGFFSDYPTFYKLLKELRVLENKDELPF